MSPQQMNVVQRFTSHFLEADAAEDAAAATVNDGGLPAVSRLPLQPSAAFGLGFGFGAAGSAGGADLLLGAGRACALNAYGGSGLVPAAAAPDRSTVIPPMKRRLITLSTAGNLKISPLSNQQFHYQRVYPVRRPSDDGAPGPAAATAVAAAIAAAAAAQMENQRDPMVQQPPPPPGTPARQPHTPSSSHLAERRQLSPRDDNILILHVSGDNGGDPSLEPPPLFLATPRGSVDGRASAAGACSTGCIATPRLVLRPVRPRPENLPEVCGADLAWPENSPVAAPGVAQRPRQQCVTIEVVGRRSSGYIADSCALEATEPESAGVFDPRVSALLEVDPSRPDWLQNAPLRSQDIRNADQTDTHEQAGLGYQHHPSGCVQELQQPRCYGLPCTLIDQAEGQLGPEATGMAAAAPPIIESGMDAAAMEMDRHSRLLEGGDCFVPPPDATTPSAVQLTATTTAVNAAAADAATAAASVEGMPWASIEVTVAIRPKAGTVRRQLRFGSGVDGSAVIKEAQNGYVRGPVCGMFDLTRYLTGRDCVRHCGRWLSRSQFEKIGGSTMAKWYRSIRVLPDLEPLGEWLERHGMPVLRGPARRSRKRLSPYADSGDEETAAAGTAIGCPPDCGFTAHEGMDVTGIHPDLQAAALGEADGGGDAAPHDGWANRMLLQNRDGCGGDDLLVQRLLNSWPLSQPYLRQAQQHPVTACEQFAATATDGRKHRENLPVRRLTGNDLNGNDLNGNLNSVGCRALPQQHWPADLPIPGAGNFASADTRDAACVAAQSEVHEIGSVSQVHITEPACTSGVPSSPFVLAGPPAAAGARVSGMGLKPSTPRSPRLFNALPVGAMRRALPPMAAAAAAAAAGTTDRLGRLGQWQPPSDSEGGQHSLDRPSWGPLAPPAKRFRQDLGLAGPRPRLLLHRTASSGAGDGRGGGQPYLFAVQAPPGMLYRGCVPSPFPAAAAAAADGTDHRTGD